MRYLELKEAFRRHGRNLVEVKTPTGVILGYRFLHDGVRCHGARVVSIDAIQRKAIGEKVL